MPKLVISRTLLTRRIAEAKKMQKDQSPKIGYESFPLSEPEQKYQEMPKKLLRTKDLPNWDNRRYVLP